MKGHVGALPSPVSQWHAECHGTRAHLSMTVPMWRCTCGTVHYRDQQPEQVMKQQENDDGQEEPPG